MGAARDWMADPMTDPNPSANPSEGKATSQMSVRSATMWAAIGQYSSFALQFAASVIVARFFLDPAEVGVFSVAFSAAALVHGLQDFGLNRFIVGAKVMDDRLLRVSFLVSVAVAIFITGTILLIAQPLADFYEMEALFAIAVVIAIAYGFVPFSVVPLAMLQRELEFGKLAFVEIGGSVISVSVTITAAWMGYSSLSLALGVLAFQISRAGLTQLVNPLFRLFPVTLKGTASVFTYGGWSGVLSLTGSAASRAPDLIVGKVLGDVAVGLYGRATGLAGQIGMLVGGPVEAVFYPSFARARDRDEDLAQHYLKLTAALCAVTFAAMIGIAAVAHPLVLGLYGERWAEVAPLLILIALAQVFRIALPLHIDIGYLMGGWRRVIQLTLLDAAISITLLLIAAPYGIIWAAASRIAHGAVWWVIHAVFLQRLIKFRWSALFSIYAKTTLAALAAIAPLTLGYALWLSPAQMPLLIAVPLCLCGVPLWYAALVALSHPSAEDLANMARDQIWPMASRLKKRMRA